MITAVFSFYRADAGFDYVDCNADLWIDNYLSLYSSVWIVPGTIDVTEEE